MNSFLVLVFLSLIIVVHEYGHFLAAKTAGVRVLNFFIGFGPSLWQKKIGKTHFAINLFPLGGAVVLAGLDEGLKAKVPRQEEYQHKSWSQKFWIISAGTFMNIVLGLIIFIITYSLIGIPQNISNVIGTVIPNTPAAAAKLKPGDKIIALNNRLNLSPEEIIKIIHNTRPGYSIKFTLQRESKKINLNIKPLYNQETQSSAIGIILKPANYKKLNIFKAVYYGAIETFSFVTSFLQGLSSLFFNFQVENVAGPIGIFNLSQQAWQYGPAAFLRFFAILSLNIGLLNLLPLPALDGGRLFFLIIEKITRRSINKKFEKYVHLIGFMILLGLIFWVSYNDIHRLLK